MLVSSISMATHAGRVGLEGLQLLDVDGETSILAAIEPASSVMPNRHPGPGERRIEQRPSSVPRPTNDPPGWRRNPTCSTTQIAGRMDVLDVGTGLAPAKDWPDSATAGRACGGELPAGTLYEPARGVGARRTDAAVLTSPRA